MKWMTVGKQQRYGWQDEHTKRVNKDHFGKVIIRDLLGAADVHLGHLETAEARRLREQAEGAKDEPKTEE